MSGRTKTGAPEPRSVVDWKEIHHRLERAAMALAEKATPTPEVKKRILQQRAKSLARARETDARELGQLEIVEFLLAYERYAIESSWVGEVYPLKELTPLPG